VVSSPAARRREERHMQFIEQASKADSTDHPHARRYGAIAQRDERQGERSARRAAVGLSRWAQQRGMSCQVVAGTLGRSVRTLSSWRQQWAATQLQPQPRGRPAPLASVEDRNRLIAVLRELGPHTGVPTCQALFSHLPRRQVEDIVRRFKEIDRSRQRKGLSRLCWRRPGTVWAMDHSYPPAPIDGFYTRIFALRDLASGYQLGWDAVPDESAEHVVGILVTLFVLYGPPLVIKADNGSPFISQAVRELLAFWAVALLLSPPRRPQYNGSVEAANGPMKTRTEHQAVLAGRPGIWTSDDLAVARDQANQLLRPRGPHGPTPHDLWQRRPPINDQHRRRFAAAVADFGRRLGLFDAQPPADAQPEPTVISARPQAAGRSVCVTRARSKQGALERRAIVNALSACKLLHIRRRLLTLPVTS
jgi:transposase InsO family protein